MTITEALLNCVNYPLNDGNVETIAVARGIVPSVEFTADIAKSREYELCYADVLRFVATMVNLSQGGSVTQSSVGTLTGTANAIYRKWGEPVIGEGENNKPIVTIC